jgi:hypothetical protein
VKAYGLFLGIIENPQKEISHKTPRVYLKLLRFSWVEDFSKIYTPNINLQENLTVLDSLVKDENKKNVQDLDKNIPFFLDFYEASLKQARKSFSQKEVRIIINEVKRRYGKNIKEIYIMQIEFALLLYLFSFVTWIYNSEPRYSGEYDKLNIMRYLIKL